MKLQFLEYLTQWQKTLRHKGRKQIKIVFFLFLIKRFDNCYFLFLHDKTDKKKDEIIKDEITKDEIANAYRSVYYSNYGDTRPNRKVKTSSWFHLCNLMSQI